MISEEEFMQIRKIVREEVREAITDLLETFRDAVKQELKKHEGK